MEPGVKKEAERENRVHSPLQSDLFFICSAGMLHNLGQVPENQRRFSNWLLLSSSLFVRDQRNGVLDIREREVC